MNKIDSPSFSIWLSVFISGLALFSWLFMDHQFLLQFVEEDGFVETLTVVLYFLTILLILFYKSPLSIFMRIATVVILLEMAARELDLHKFLGLSILKIKFWLGSETPMINRVIAVCVLMPLAISCFYLIKTKAANWFKQYKLRINYSVTIMVFFVVLVVSKIFDRSLGVLTELFGWHFPVWLVAFQQSQEEYLECLLPVLIAIAVIQFARYPLSKLKNSES